MPEMGDTLWLILMVIFGLGLGATMPDIDLAPPLPIKHRSLWTHGPALPGLALWAVGKYPAWWPFWAAFLFSLAIHLLKDMFPRSWSGGALIKFYPLAGNFGPVLSFIYLGLGVAAAVWVFLKLPIVDMFLIRYLSL